MGEKSWKSLFINNDDNKKEEVTTSKVDSKKETNTKFPEATQTSNFGFNQMNSNAVVMQPQVNLQISEELAGKFLEAYQTAFEKLNQDGYDFFEFFQAVIHADINNPQTYNMAFGMGKAMDKTASKEKLLSQSDYYISELNSLYQKNVSDGNQKKQDLINQKQTENQNLNEELFSLKQQFEAIQVQIQDKQNKLNLIDSKYQPKIAEYDNKLLANDYAKNKVLSTIETVKQGITQNLK